MKKAIIVLFALLVNYPLFANCGNDNGNGNGCSDNGGTPGPQGPVGPQGPAGTNGTNGANGKNGTNADPEPKRSLQGEIDVRLWDTKRTSFYLFNSYGFDDSPEHDTVLDGRNATYGVKFVVKLGTSYEERLIEQLKAEVMALHRGK